MLRPIAADHFHTCITEKVAQQHPASCEYRKQGRQQSRCQEACRHVMPQASFLTPQNISGILRVSRRHALLGVLSSLAFSLKSQEASAGLIDEKQADKVFQSASQSVVSIADYKIANGTETSEGTGSGFFWDTHGHVVTNYHCVSKFATDRIGAQVRRGTNHTCLISRS